MFEVGKRYRNNLGWEFTCNAVGRTGALLDMNGSETFVNNDVFRSLTEIRPKRRIEAWVNVYSVKEKLKLGILHEIESDAKDARDIGYLDTIKIEYEEK